MLRRFALVPLTCLFAVFLAHSPATASAAEESPKHCVANLGTGKTTCYPSFAEAMSRVSGGKFNAISAPNQLTDTVVAQIGAAQQNYVIGILFDDVNFGGATLTYEQYNPCSTSVVVDFQTPISSWFNDRTSSYRGYSNCLLQIWEHTYTGGRHGPYASASSVSSTLMNDRASSVQFY